MKQLNSTLKKQAQQSEDLDFSGFKLQAYKEGKKIVDLKVGKTYRFYDLASLTKIIFTTTWFMESFECDNKILSRKVKDILPWYKHSRVQVGQLLNHSAGNEWWEPFYKNISRALSPEQAYQQMEDLCRKAPLSKTSRAVYSDIDFYLLGSVMQKIEGQPLAEIWKRVHAKFFARTKFHFNYQNKPRYSPGQYGPTEKCSWRKKTVRGQAHDENCWALGGMAPHAGVFGGIDDLSSYGLWLRGVWLGKDKNIRSATLKKFSTRSLPKKRGDWGYGFMLPSEKGSSAGEKFSKTSFGHTGFTGTSFWFDPKRDLFVALVSNRVYPSRNNKGFVRLRPKLHDWLVEEIEDCK